MKKILVVVLSVAMLMLCGCERDEVANPNEDTGSIHVNTFVDKATGVNYYTYNRGYGGGMTLRVNADGTPYVSEVK